MGADIEISLINHIPSIITKEEDSYLNVSPSKEEVKKAVFELNEDSACGPDGFFG